MMRKHLMAAAAAGPPVAAVRRFRPAQVYLGADPGGATFKLVRSVLAWGRATNDAGDYYYAYRPDCPVVRERVVTPDGRVIYRTQRVCH